MKALKDENKILRTELQGRNITIDKLEKTISKLQKDDGNRRQP